MSLMLIKQLLDSKNNEHKLDATLVVDSKTGKDVLSHVAESVEKAINLLKDGTTDGSGNLPEDYNTLLKISNSMAGLKTTINDFLTGEANEGDIDRLVELVKAISDNKDAIDKLVINNLTKADLVDGLTSEATDKALTAAQGKALKDLIDAIETHVHDNMDVLSGLSKNAAGDLTFNGKTLDGATSVALVSAADATPVFDEKLILVVTPLTVSGSEQGAGA